MFGKPTLINNVETLVNVLEILLHRRAGLRRDRHARIDRTAALLPVRQRHPAGCLRGAVRRRPCGRCSIWPAAWPAGGRCRAILLGGAAGVFVRPDELDMPLTFEGARAAKATLGSGVIMVFDDTVDLAPILLRIAAFFRDESCGQCVPCRVGTVRQEEALHRIHAGRTRAA